MRVRKEELRRQFVGATQVHVDIGIELIFVVVSWQDSRVVDAAARSLRAWDDK